MAIVIAAAYTTAKTHSLVDKVNVSGTDQWSPVGSVGKTFQGLVWSAVGVMFLASACFVLDMMRW